MSFEEHLQTILQQKQLSAKDRESYNEDARIIRDYLMQQMKERNAAFKAAFNGLSLTGSYLDKLKIDLPDEFDMHIKLKMPFDLKPMQYEQCPGFIYLKTNSRGHALIGRKGKIPRYPLQMWLRSLFLAAIGDGISVNVNGRIYHIEYPTYARGKGVAHTVRAKDVSDAKREIWFDFVPAFEFLPNEWPFPNDEFDEEDRSWFAIPYGKKIHTTICRKQKYSFMVCAPHWERKALGDKQNLKNSLRLMKALRDANNFQRLTSYMLKSIYLGELENRTNQFWEQPMGEILIAMLKVLAEALDTGCLPFFLHKGHNIFDLLPKKLIDVYKQRLANVLYYLQKYRDQGNVNFKDVQALFER